MPPKKGILENLPKVNLLAPPKTSSHVFAGDTTFKQKKCDDAQAGKISSIDLALPSNVGKTIDASEVPIICASAIINDQSCTLILDEKTG